MSINFITNEELYKQAIEPVAVATSFVWIVKYCKNCKRIEFCGDPIL